MPSSSHSSFPPLPLLICASPSSFLGSHGFFSQGYQCPCPRLTYLVGVRLATPPCKKTSTATTNRGRGRDRSSGTSGHLLDPSILRDPTVQTSRVPRYQRGRPTGMTDAGESLQGPCVLRGAGGPPSPISNFRGAGGAADVAPTR